MNLAIFISVLAAGFIIVLVQKNDWKNIHARADENAERIKQLVKLVEVLESKIEKLE